MAAGFEVDQPFVLDRDVQGVAGGRFDVPQSGRVDRSPVRCQKGE
jgi:hypothetical protein